MPAGRIVQVVLDNYAANKHFKVRASLGWHPRVIFHFTPSFGDIPALPIGLSLFIQINTGIPLSLSNTLAMSPVARRFAL